MKSVNVINSSVNTLPSKVLGELKSNIDNDITITVIENNNYVNISGRLDKVVTNNWGGNLMDHLVMETLIEVISWRPNQYRFIYSLIYAPEIHSIHIGKGRYESTIYKRE